MFKKFIVATDLSSASDAVVNCLSGLKNYGAENCLLLQCLSFAEAASTAYSYSTGSLDKLLASQKMILEQQGFRVEARSVVGTPKREINRIAVHENYDLIVVGAQGQSIAEEKVLGGVAYGIVNKTSKPILVVPVEKGSDEKEACKPVTRCGFSDHVLFATDFSEMADNAFDYVKQLMAHGARKVTLVHVQDKTKLEQHLKNRLEEFNEHDRRRLENLKQDLLNVIPTEGLFFGTPSPENLKKAILLKDGTTQVDTEVCYGVPYEEITRLVQERNVQMVVMGTQGRSFVSEFFLGSVSHNVARYSVAPVLLIPFKNIVQN